MFFLQTNQRRLLNSLNPLVIVLFVFLLILLRTTFDPLLPWWVRRTDVLLPCVIYFGQRRNLFEGLVLALFVGHLYSLCSAAPIGLFTTHYLFLFLLSRVVAYVVYANFWYIIIPLIFCLALVSRISLVLMATFFSHGWSIGAEVSDIVGWVISTTLAGYWIFWGLAWIDRVSYKAPSQSIELSSREI